MSGGPYLYDEGPERPGTGSPRSRNGHLIALLLITVLVAVGMVVGLFWYRGSPADQAEEVTGVFLAALAADDTETAFALLCDEERATLQPDDLAGRYTGSGTPDVGAAGEAGEDAVVLVPVRWSGGGSAEIRVVPEGGAKVCGLTGG